MSDSIPPVAPWEDAVLRAIAIYKFVKAALALALAVTLFHLVHRDVTLFLQHYFLEPLHFDPDDYSESHFLTWVLREATDLTPHTKRLLAYASFFYASVFAIEGTGLYLKKHWAEYMVIVVTVSFLPFEAIALYYHVVWWKVLLIIGNLLIIGYLIHRIRLDAHNAARKKRETAALTPSSSANSADRAMSQVP